MASGLALPHRKMGVARLRLHQADCRSHLQHQHGVRRVVPSPVGNASSIRAAISSRPMATRVRNCGWKRRKPVLRSHRARGTYAGYAAGQTFSLSEHPVSGETGQSYVLETVTHEAADYTQFPIKPPAQGTQERPYYRNAFTCMPSTVLYVPPRRTPRPIMRGPQTAVVTGRLGRRNLHGSIRPRARPVSVGPAWAERRQEFMLHPRRTNSCGSGLGHAVHTARRHGSGCRFSRRQSRPGRWSRAASITAKTPRPIRCPIQDPERIPQPQLDRRRCQHR